MKAQLICYAVLFLMVKCVNATPVHNTPATLRACPSQCACSVQEDRELVAILCAGQNLSTIPTTDASLPLVVQLDISYNDIELLPNNAFKEYPTVEKIDAALNKISTIELGAFYGVDFLQEVDLSQNIIMYIHPDTFIANPNLKILNLSNNPLTKISSSIPILNIPSLTNLDISYCQLQTVTQHMFTGVPKLEILDISNNDMEYFPIKSLKNLDSLVDIKLDYNRWSCDDCNLVRTLSELALRRPELTEEENYLSCLDSNGSLNEVSVLMVSDSCENDLILDVTTLVANNATSTDNDTTETFVVGRKVNVFGDLWVYLQHHLNLVHTFYMLSFMLTVIMICSVLGMVCVIKRSTSAHNCGGKQELLTKNLQLAYSEPDRKRGSLVPLLEDCTQDHTPAPASERNLPTDADNRPPSLYEEFLLTRPNSDHLYFAIQ